MFQKEPMLNLPIDHLHLTCLPNLMHYAKDVAIPPEDRWMLLSADELTAATGQHDRKWFAPKGNIYAVLVLLFPKKKLPLFLKFPQVIGLSIAEALADYGFKSKLKWVNDVLIGGKKVAGVLCTYHACPVSGFYRACLGFSVDVNVSPEMLLGVDQPVTSLYMETGNQFNIQEVLYKITEKIYHEAGLLLEQGFAPFVDRINGLMAFKDDPMQLLLTETGMAEKQTVSGVLRGVDSLGRLLLETLDGVQAFEKGRLFPFLADS